MNDLALVLRRFDFGESSQTARLYTRSGGRTAVLARGIRRPQNLLLGPLELFTLAEVETLPRKGDLHLLIRYRVRTGFPGIRALLERLYGAFLLTEILREGTRDGDPDPGLFDAAVAGLSALEAGSAQQVLPAVAWFGGAFLRSAGLEPRLDECVNCDRAAPPGRSVRFVPWLGGVVCGPCLEQRPLRFRVLSAPERVALNQVFGASLPTEAGEAAGPLDRLAAVFPLILDMIQGHLEKELRAAPFVMGEA